MAREAGGPASTFSLKIAGAIPETEAETCIAPDFVPALYEVLAKPNESVVAVGGDNVPPAPPSENVTRMPEMPFPAESLTFTFSGFGNVVVTCADWLLPEEIATTAGEPAS